MSKKFAVFDIDGTIIRWQLYHAISDSLYRGGFFDDQAFKRVKEARMVWKRREHPDAYREYEHALVAAYDDAILKISYHQFMSAVHSTFDEYKEQTYTYTRELLLDLKKQNYLLFAISASQKEVVQLFAEYYGFDDFGGSSYEHDGQAFTGQKHVLKREEKPKLLAELAAKHGTSFKGSVGVGDSDSDIPMLETVEQPIAFNPNKPLLQHAKSKSWRVVVERKSQIYTLEPDEHGYRLV